jgi:ribose transport system permease protein
VIASGIAALFMAQLGQMVLALGASASTQLLVQAAAIVIATAVQNVSLRSLFAGR